VIHAVCLEVALRGFRARHCDKLHLHITEVRYISRDQLLFIKCVRPVRRCCSERFFGPIRSFSRTVPGERPADSLVAALTDRLRPIFLRQRNTVRRQRQPLAIHGLAQCYLGPFACVADLPSRQSLRFVGTNRLVVPISRLSTVGIAKLFWSVSSLPGGKEASIRCKGASRNSTWNRIRVDNTPYRVSTSTSAVELTV